MIIQGVGGVWVGGMGFGTPLDPRMNNYMFYVCRFGQVSASQKPRRMVLLGWGPCLGWAKVSTIGPFSVGTPHIRLFVCSVVGMGGAAFTLCILCIFAELTLYLLVVEQTTGQKSSP